MTQATAASGTKFSLKDPRVLALCVIALLALVVFAFRILSARPPALDKDTLTQARLDDLTARVQIFAVNNQRLPQAVSEVPEGSGSISSANDAWGRAFELEPGEKGPWKTSLVIRSCGKDGSKGTDDDKHLDEAESLRFLGDDSLIVVWAVHRPGIPSAQSEPKEHP